MSRRHSPQSAMSGKVEDSTRRPGMSNHPLKEWNFCAWQEMGSGAACDLKRSPMCLVQNLAWRAHTGLAQGQGLAGGFEPQEPHRPYGQWGWEPTSQRQASNRNKEYEARRERQRRSKKTESKSTPDHDKECKSSQWSDSDQSHRGQHERMQAGTKTRAVPGEKCENTEKHVFS